MALAASGIWQTLTAWAEKRLPALTRYRRAEALPIRLHSRRIYILPTRFGLIFAAVVFAMLLGALNFNNNPALLLSFLVSAIAVLSFHRTVAQLRGIRVTALRADRAHAGHSAQVHLYFEEQENRARPDLMLEQDGQEIHFLLDANQRASVPLNVQATRRGWQSVGRWRLWTEYPFGIVWAWSYLYPEEKFLVYPKPEDGAPPLPGDARNEPGQRFRPPGDDWIGLRDHHTGDSPRHVAWRASARSDRLLVKEFADPIAKAVVLDYAELGALAHELRIQRLTRWVLTAESAQLRFQMRLPGQSFGPAQGSDHAQACLRALALLP